jgi:hypothetical protein
MQSKDMAQRDPYSDFSGTPSLGNPLIPSYNHEGQSCEKMHWQNIQGPRQEKVMKWINFPAKRTIS